MKTKPYRESDPLPTMPKSPSWFSIKWDKAHEFYENRKVDLKIAASVGMIVTLLLSLILIPAIIADARKAARITNTVNAWTESHHGRLQECFRGLAGEWLCRVTFPASPNTSNILHIGVESERIIGVDERPNF